MDENKIPDNIINFPIRDKKPLIEKIKEDIFLLDADIKDRKLSLKEEEESLEKEKMENPDYNFSGLEPRITLQKNEIAKLERLLAAKKQELQEMLEKE